MLSPFLWSVLIDDVLRLFFGFVFLVVGYADDLTTSHKDPNQVTHNLQLMCNQVGEAGPILDTVLCCTVTGKIVKLNLKI